MSESKNSFEGCKIEQEEDENFQQGLIDNQLEKCTGLRSQKGKVSIMHTTQTAKVMESSARFSFASSFVYCTSPEITSRHGIVLLFSYLMLASTH